MERFNLYIQKSGCDAKPHQAEGVEWMVANETRPSPPMHCRGGFIADEMGLGKTIMMIGTLLANLLTRTLIVLPPALVEQWYREIHRTTGHRAVIYHGAKAKDFDAEKLASARIVITTYAMISVTYKETKDKKTGLPKKKKDPNVLHQVRWNRVVFDEAHHLRNRNSRWYGATTGKNQSSIRSCCAGPRSKSALKSQTSRRFLATLNGRTFKSTNCRPWSTPCISVTLVLLNSGSPRSCDAGSRAFTPAC